MPQFSALKLVMLLQRWWPAILLGGLWCLLQACGGLVLWGYERQAIEHGQFWRLLSGQMVHLNGQHLVLNLLGLGGIMVLWSREWTTAARMLAMFIGSACAVAVGLWFFAPEVVWYAGASGALHGMLAAGLVLATQADRWLRLWLALALLAKLVWEVHAHGGTAALIGAPVIHAAHQFGALGGLMSALLWRLFAQR